MLGFAETRLGNWIRRAFGGAATLRDVLPAAVLIAACALLVKAFAAGKELLIAFRFGTSTELDAFLFAYMFPAFLISIVSASFQTAFIPRFIEVKTQFSIEKARIFAGQGAALCACGLVVTAVVIAPICGVAIPNLAQGFDSDTVSNSQKLLYLLMPLIVINGLASFWSGVLNAEKRFAVPALTPIVTPIVVAGAVWVSWGELGIFSVAFGTLAGAIVEVIIVATVVRRAEFPLFHPVGTIDANQKAMLRQFVPAAIAGVLMSGTAVIDQTMAATLDAGSVSSLSFGTKLTGVVAGVLVMAITTVTLPFFSRLISVDDWSTIRRSLMPGAMAIAFVSVVTAIVIWKESTAIVEVLFQRGEFKADDTLLVSRVQAWHSLQIPFYALSMVAFRLIAAMAASRLLMIGAALNLFSDLLLNLLLVPAYGIVGVAMASSGMYVISCTFLWAVALRHFHRIAVN